MNALPAGKEGERKEINGFPMVFRDGVWRMEEGIESPPNGNQPRDADDPERR